MVGVIKMKTVSFIITTIKEDIETTKHLKKCPLEHEIIIPVEKGIGFARNIGASLSQGEVLVFLDDDLTIYPKLFEIIPKVQEGSFFMAFQAKMPVTRCLIIHRKDFRKVLFREEIKLSGEDRDFFMRAIKTGLKPFFLSPKGLYQHKEHKIRFKKNRLNSIIIKW